jgi:hypothetical protein
VALDLPARRVLRDHLASEAPRSVGSNGFYYQDNGRKLWMFGHFTISEGGSTTCEKLVGYLPSRPGDPGASGPFPLPTVDNQFKWIDWWQWSAKGAPLGQIPKTPEPYCSFTETLKADGTPLASSGGPGSNGP